jgi:hypothetical protein
LRSVPIEVNILGEHTSSHRIATTFELARHSMASPGIDRRKNSFITIFSFHVIPFAITIVFFGD